MESTTWIIRGKSRFRRDGAFAYADSIHENAITWFERNASTGALSYKGHAKEAQTGSRACMERGRSSFRAMGCMLTGRAHGRYGDLVRPRPGHRSPFLCPNGSTYAQLRRRRCSGHHRDRRLYRGGSFEHNADWAERPPFNPFAPPSQPNHVVDLNATVNLEMIWVEPGTFTMGSPLDGGRGNPEMKLSARGHPHQALLLGQVRGNSSSIRSGDDGEHAWAQCRAGAAGRITHRPVEKVSLEDIQKFLTRLNAEGSGRLSLQGGRVCCPPSSKGNMPAVQARLRLIHGGIQSLRSSLANFNGSNIGTRPMLVRRRVQPTRGAFTTCMAMCGNGCRGSFGCLCSGAVTDPEGPATGSLRVLAEVTWAMRARPCVQPASATSFQLPRRLLASVSPSKYTAKPPTDLQFHRSLDHCGEPTDRHGGGDQRHRSGCRSVTLTYHLVSGAGDGNNSLFTLETNGTLKTATIFDYETNAWTYHSIRVQVKDEFNATMEGNFTVTLSDLAEDPPGQPNNEGNSTNENNQTEKNETTDPTNPGVDGNSSKEGNATVPSPVPDYFRPIVDTLPAAEVNGTTAQLHGALMDTGGQVPTERGFLLSFRPNPKENDSGVILVAESNAELSRWMRPLCRRVKIPLPGLRK